MNKKIMFKSFILIVIILSIFSSCQAQIKKDSLQQYQCLRANMTNKSLIFYLEVSYKSVGRITGKDGKKLSLLFQKNKEALDSFQYSIEFTIPSCVGTFYVPSKDKDELDKLYNLKKGTNIKLRCRIVPQLFKEGTWFFYIDKVVGDVSK